MIFIGWRWCDAHRNKEPLWPPQSDPDPDWPWRMKVFTVGLFGVFGLALCMDEETFEEKKNARK